MRLCERRPHPGRPVVDSMVSHNRALGFVRSFPIGSIPPALAPLLFFPIVFYISCVLLVPRSFAYPCLPHINAHFDWFLTLMDEKIFFYYYLAK